MQQLGLNIVPRLSYSASGFLLHHGIIDDFHRCLSAIESSGFSIAFFYGPTRSGKTHLSIKFAETLTERGFFPTLLEGDQFSSWIQAKLEEQEKLCFAHDEVILLDDADLYFSSLSERGSGEFVNLVEAMRLAKANIVFFSSTDIDSLNIDQHAFSRLRPGLGFKIGHPDEDELIKVLELIAKQRGVQLSSRNLSYLSKRLKRDIPSLEYNLERILHLSQVLGKSIKFPLISDVANID